MLHRPIETAVISGRSASYQANGRFRAYSGHSNGLEITDMTGCFPPKADVEKYENFGSTQPLSDNVTVGFWMHYFFLNPVLKLLRKVSFEYLPSVPES